MTLQEDLINAEAKLVQAQNDVLELKAEIFLTDLFLTATHSSKLMATYYDGQIEHRLFTGNELSYYLRANDLVKYIRSRASHFKFMDDSQVFPEWKTEAVKQAKILQEIYSAKFKY